MANPFRDSANPQWEQLINSLENGTGLEAGAIGTTQLAAGAVTEPKLGAEAVTGAKVKKESLEASRLLPNVLTPTQVKAATAKPAEPAEKAVTANAASIAQKVAFEYQSDGVETKIKLKHSLETLLVQVTGQKATAGKEPGLVLFVSAAAEETAFKWEPISASEVEVTLGKAPAAKTLLFFTVVG